MKSTDVLNPRHN